MLAVLAVVGVLSGCGGAADSVPSANRPVSARNTAEEISSTLIKPRELRKYLSAWEVSWRGLASDLVRGEDEGALGYSSTPDPSWERARRLYDRAASAYRDHVRRLVVLAPPPPLQRTHDAYLAAVRRQAARFEAVADAFGGSDPHELDRALDALQTSQMTFDLDGAAWEQAVITACEASGVEVPEIVRLELISNGQRTRDS
jgi:hypothetical protein